MPGPARCAARGAAAGPAASGFGLGEAAAEQLQPVVDQLEAEPGGDLLRQGLVPGIGELDHLAGVDIDQVVVRAMLGRLVAGAGAAEIVALEDALLLQQPDRAVDRGDGDMGVALMRAAVQFLDIRVVGAFGQDAGDQPALPGHLQAALDAQPLDAGDALAVGGSGGVHAARSRPLMVGGRHARPPVVRSGPGP